MKIKKFNKFYVKEDDGGGASVVVSVADGSAGVAYANQGTTTGMGNVVAAIPSELPGDVAGSTIGSGDKSSGFIQPSFKTFNPKKNKKGKRKKIEILNQLDMKVMSYDDYINNLYK